MVHRQLLAAVAAGGAAAEPAAGLVPLAALPAPQPPLPGADVSSKVRCRGGVAGAGLQGQDGNRDCLATVFGVGLAALGSYSPSYCRLRFRTSDSHFLDTVSLRLCDSSSSGLLFLPPLSYPIAILQAAVMNERHRTAKRAQKDCSDLYLLLLLHAQVLAPALPAACCMPRCLPLLCLLLAAPRAARVQVSITQMQTPPRLLGFLPQMGAPSTPRSVCLHRLGGRASQCRLPLNCSQHCSSRFQVCAVPHPPMLLQPHVEAATVYGLRRQSLLVFLPKYHLKVRTHRCCVARLCLLLVFCRSTT